MEYRIERLSLDNLGMLVPLYQTVFGQKISREFLQRKYDTEAFGTAYIGYLAFSSENQLAGYYGVIPCHFLINGKTFLAAQSADTMTHPAHRNKGLFVTLATKTYALARELQINFIFGFPNQNSRPGFVKLGWRFMEEEVQVLSMDVGGFGYARLLRYTNLFSKLYKSLWGQWYAVRADVTLFPDQSKCGVKHDALFFQYKTYSETMVLTVHGVAVWAKVDGKLKVGAVSGLTELNAQQFLDTLKAKARRLGCDGVVFMTTKKSILYSILVRRLGSSDGFPIGFFSLIPNGQSFETASFGYCDIDIF